MSFRLSLMIVYFMFSLESPHRGDSNEYKQCTIFQYGKEIHPNFSQICSYRVSFSRGLRNGFDTAEVDGPSLFEPLEFYCSNITSASP